MTFRRLFDLFHVQLAHNPMKKALVGGSDDPGSTFDTGGCLHEIDRVSAGLMELGLSRGDRVAVLSPAASPRWLFLDFAMQQLGILGMAVHPSTPPDQLERLLLEADARACLAANRELYDKVASVRHKVLGLKYVYTMLDLPDMPGWSDLLREPTERHLETLHSTRAAVHEDDPAFIAYTTGAGGLARGVFITHKNVITNIHTLAGSLPLRREKRYLSLLPPSLMFERLSMYAAIAGEMTLHFSRPAEGVLAATQRVKPHVSTLLPRMVEHLYEFLLGESLKSGKMRRDLWSWAARLGQTSTRGKRPPLSYWLRHKMALALVFPRWHRRLGGQLEALLIAGDRLRPELGRLFSATGIAVWQSYGLTETAGLASIGRLSRNDGEGPGALQLLPHLEGRLQAEDEKGRGALLLRGPNVMPGYLDKLSGKIPGDWLVTGDMASLADDQVQVYGPIHAQFRLENGSLVFPALREAALKRSPFVDQCLVFGAGRPFATALILPQFSLLKRWCAENGISWKAPPFMISEPEVIDLFQSEIDQLGEEEHIGAFTLIHQPWTLEKGERTPSLKLRREVILKTYAEQIEAMYQTS